MLLEEDVRVQCRQSDVTLVESCLAEASSQYADVIKKSSGATKKCKLTIDKTQFLPPAPVPNSEAKSCLGGVVLSCQGGSIVIDNTIDLRLKLVLEQDKPAIRTLLFPLK